MDSEKFNINDENLSKVAEAVAERIMEHGVGVTDFTSGSTIHSDLVDGIDSTTDINQVSAIDSDVRSRYDLYDNMSKDSVISAALEMYADDAFTTNADNAAFTVTQRVDDKNNKEVVSQAENFLHLLEMDEKLWEMYYQLAKYGECYLELFYKREQVGRIDGKSSRLEDLTEILVMEPFCEVVDRPDKVVDIIYRGSTLFYTLSKDSENDGFIKENINEQIALPAHKYIHFTLGVEDSKRKNSLEIRIGGKDSNEVKAINPIYQSEFEKQDLEDAEKIIYGKVLRGRSILYDIEKAYKNLSIMENVVMIGKLSRSTVTRVANVEVGSMSKADTRKAIQRVKSKLKNKVAISEDAGSSNYIDVTGLDNTIINPISNGKGAVEVSTITSTDPDIKSVADLEYFSNKLFGGLKIPKAYLGFESDLNDNGGDTLAQLSIRYSRTIRKIQTSVERGLENLCYLYLKANGSADSVAGNIKVNITPPMTKEEQEKLEVLSTKLETINTIIEMLPNEGDLQDQAKMILLQDLGNASLTNLIVNHQKAKLFENENVEETDETI